MHESTSGSEEGSTSSQRQGQFIVHQLSKTDNLAGLAVRYNVSVSDIKRANSLLSDSAMFAKDTLLIPTQALPVGLECATWAGMIVGSYGRVGINASRNSSPLSGLNNLQPSSLAALDQLQQYYGTSADCTSEPGHGRSDSEAGDLELTTLDLHTSSHAVSADGMPSDRRLRRRRGEEVLMSRHGSSASLAGASDDGHPSPPLPPGASPGRPPLHQSVRSRTPPPLPPSIASGEHLPPSRGIARSTALPASGPGAGPMAPGGHHRKESFLDKIKRAASQPALAGPPNQPSLARMGDAAVSSLTVASHPPSENGSTAMQRVASVVQLKREKDSAKTA